MAAGISRLVSCDLTCVLVLKADAYFAKPLNFDELLGALRAHLNLPERPRGTGVQR
jgi:DNA-binding response OmpR family regulator